MLTAAKEARVLYDKVCGVCGDSARCSNYGGISCESCKSFFRRANTNKTWKLYQCMNGSNCLVDVYSRKDCKACRYRRCLENGMDSKGLRSEKDLTADLARKRSGNSLIVSTRGSSQNTTFNPIVKLDPQAVKLNLADKSKYFNIMEIVDLDNLTSKYANAFYDIRYTEETMALTNGTLKAAALITETLQRIFLFSGLVPQFQELDLHDRLLLLSRGASELSLLNAVLSYDPDAERWPRPDCRVYRTCYVKRQELADIVGVECCDKEVEFIISIQRLRPDELVLTLMVLLILFHPGRENLKNPDLVAKHQKYFGRLLKNYLNWRYGAAHESTLFHNFVSRLMGLRLNYKFGYNMYKLFERHPEMKEAKCCRTFFALGFGEDGVCINTVLK